MPVQRSGLTPAFVEYLTKYALTPNYNTGNISAVISLNPSWVEIPRFQRGISWKIDNIEEFYESKSILLGNVIMGSFAIPPAKYPNLNPPISNYNYLMDGLQRFSVGTIMLRVLHDAVLKPNPNFPNEVIYFNRIIPFVQPYNAIYLHNHNEFVNHPRAAISHPYTDLYNKFITHVKEIFNSGQAQSFADNLMRLFCDRQIAIDPYYNFSSTTEIVNTFIGINTVRVDLNVIDLVRSSLIERGEVAGWTANQVESTENRFTEVFCNSNGSPDGDLLPFVGIVWAVFRDDSQTQLFPSWNGSLNILEVERFIDFIEFFKAGNINNSFLTEIRNAGSAPYAVLISIYYYKFIFNSTTPSFFNIGGTLENVELHKFLIATYRGIISGGIGKCRPYGEFVFLRRPPAPGSSRPYAHGCFPKDVELVAEEMSFKFCSISIFSQYNSVILSSALRKITKKEAKVIFNAMLLPILSANRTIGWGNSFSPITFGTNVTQFHFNIDHIMPASRAISTNLGFPEINLLHNFAPLPCNLNRAAKAVDPSSKITTGTIYDSYINAPPGGFFKHPYCIWIVNIHSVAHTARNIDNQSKLDQGATPDLGTERINHITQFLLNRL